MTSLPLPLRRWEPELAAFPKEIALALAPVMARLAAAIGPMRSRLGDGEPDGIGALTRRGSYERLLLTEWALADEAPDEFLRRAVSAEHLFLAPVRRGPSAARRCVLIFDAGPTQLGVPRLVHVALLLVLARRARDAKVELAWGIAQAPPTLRTDTDPPAIEALLAARRSSAVRDEDVDAWRETLGARDDETWWIGDPRAPIPGMRHVAVEEPISLSPDTLEVRVGAVRLSLPRPSDDIATQLIRAPFPATRPVSPKVVASRARPIAIPRHASFALPSDGRRLAVGLDDGFWSWGLPSSPREPLGAPRRLRVPPNQTILAAGHRGRRLFGVALRVEDGATSFVVHGLGDLKVGGSVDCPFAHPHPDGVLRSASFDDRGRLVWETSAGLLCRYDGKSPPEARTILGFRTRGETRLAECTPPTRWEGEESSVALVAWGPPDRVLYRPLGVRAVVFGDGATAFAPRADDPSDRTWDVVTHAQARYAIVVPSGARVIGALAHPMVGLIIVEADERTLQSLYLGSGGSLIRASGVIEEVVCNGDVIAWRTRDGLLEVGSLSRGGVLMRLPSEAP